MPTPAELLPSDASEKETREAISKTIRMLTKEKVGKTPEQRVAIAYSQARGSTGKRLKKGENKSMNNNIKRGATKLPARGGALPVEQLTPESADKEIQIALLLSIALLQKQGMPEEEAKEMFSFICKLAKTVPKVVGTTDCNIGVNNGKFAGQEVPHLHFHIIPRFEGDNGIPFQGVVRVDVNREELPALAEKIITAMQNPTGQKSNKEKSAEEKKPEEAKKETPQPSNESPPKPKEEEKPTKSSEREWQEFVLKEQDMDIDISEIEK